MNKFLDARTAFVIVIVSWLLSFLMTLVVVLFLRDNIDSPVATPLAVIFGEVVFIAPLLIILARRTAGSHDLLDTLRQTLRINAVPATTLTVTAMLSMGVVVWADELDRLVALLIPPPEWILRTMETMRGDGPLSLLLLFCGAVVLAVATEELLFRGFLQQTLERHWKDVTRAVLVTSLVFAVIHFNPWWLIQIYLLGVLMGYLAWRTNSVLPSMVLHGINNGLAFTFVNWGHHLEPWYIWRGHVSPAVLVAGAALIVIGFKLLSKK